MTLEVVRTLSREFPDLYESTMYGSPAIKLWNRLVACFAIHRSAESGSLVVRTNFEQHSPLLDDDPETYYVTDHYEKHPVVLVRLARMRQDQLRDAPDSAFSLKLSGRTKKVWSEKDRRGSR